MYQILEAKELTTNIYLMVVEAPRVAKNCQPGQFIIVRMDEDGERIPLTICDYDREKGTVTIVFQTVGAETTRMSSLKAGDAFHDFVGPLGRASELVDEDKEALTKKNILFVAGGVGTAPVYPQVKWLHENGVAADVIVGAKNHDLLILEEEMKAVAGYFGRDVLGDITDTEVIENIPALREKFGDRAVLRALHFIDENKRVDAQVACLADNDLEGFFKGVMASGDSSFRLLQNIFATKNPAEQGLTLALEMTKRALTGKKAAWRVHGGGFAGTIQAFVPNTEVEAYKAYIEKVFGEGNCHILMVRRQGAIRV